MLNKTILESATAIIQQFWDIESYGTVPKDYVSVMTLEDKQSVETLKEAPSNLEIVILSFIQSFIVERE